MQPSRQPSSQPTQPSGQYTFLFYGSVQTFIVPANTSEIDLELKGAQGGYYSNPGGYGGYIKVSRHAVTPGQFLYIYVGAQGNSFNGGGEGTDYFGTFGGGATDVRTKIDDLTTRILVAGGGGGGAYASGGRSGGGLIGEGNIGVDSRIGGGGTQTRGGCCGYGTNGSFGMGGLALKV
eukprot:CAMPEP_0119037754 /NCGR_PEP_ID=MMETSP1177-20130426/6249_1 /TAXON_ID=2985 /ORGANISM="Ochromonas sp, Strain CCMP1899" /LENGTH=177 /DNA_ID=CAMNT_0006999405 /DNA_START=321 /DNA_END=854 /DNA_ORIENTATION=-